MIQGGLAGKRGNSALGEVRKRRGPVTLKTFQHRRRKDKLEE